VVGVAFAGNGAAEGNGFIIPVPVVRNFMREFERTGDPLFGLLPELGLHTEALVNPVMRKSCFGGLMPAHHDGCLVTQVVKHSPAHAKVLPGDILMALDVAVVSEKGDVAFRGQERLGWRYCVSTKAPGQTMEVTVLRHAEAAAAEPVVAGGATEIKLTVELAAIPRLLPRVHELDYISTYCIVGGLVILPTGAPLHEEALDGRNWAIYSGITALEDNKSLDDLEWQGCIFADVLAHPINVSYDRMKGEVVSALNGTKVKNMAHLAALIAAVEGGEIILDFECKTAGSRTYVVFDAAEARACEAEILGANKIPSWCTPGLLAGA
jgi:hypothetical protein